VKSPALPPEEVPREEDEPSSPPLGLYWKIRYWKFYRYIPYKVAPLLSSVIVIAFARRFLELSFSFSVPGI
jgi:hypothetical protein